MSLTVGVYFKKDILILRLKGELDDISVSDLRNRISNYIDAYNINHLISKAKLDYLIKQVKTKGISVDMIYNIQINKEKTKAI